MNLSSKEKQHPFIRNKYNFRFFCERIISSVVFIMYIIYKYMPWWKKNRMSIKRKCVFVWLLNFTDKQEIAHTFLGLLKRFMILLLLSFGFGWLWLNRQTNIYFYKCTFYSGDDLIWCIVVLAYISILILKHWCNNTISEIMFVPIAQILLESTLFVFLPISYETKHWQILWSF